jgi:hypothetical protein
MSQVPSEAGATKVWPNIGVLALPLLLGDLGITLALILDLACDYASLLFLVVTAATESRRQDLDSVAIDQGHGRYISLLPLQNPA